MIRRVFKDPKMQETFDRDGYVIVDLFSNKEFEGLRSVFNDINEQKKDLQFNTDSHYKLSFFSTDKAYRNHVFKSISNFCVPAVDHYLDQYEPLIVNTFDKEPGSGEVPIHQNWTFVDESKATSVSVWIPLIDATRINGTMEVVKGSQRVLSAFRSPSIPWVFENLRHEIKTKYMEPINVKIGQAVILDDSILHYTSQNDSEIVRSAIQLIMKPKDVPAIHYHLPSEDSKMLDVYEVDSDFFMRFNMHEPPKDVPKVREFSFGQRVLTESEFVSRIPSLKSS